MGKEPDETTPPVIIPETKTGVIATILALFAKQDSAAVVKEAIFLAVLIGGLTTNGVFECSRTNSIAEVQRIQIDSTSKNQADTLKKQYRNWRHSDSILTAERFDSMFRILSHKR
jgi:hypothetical protein